MQARVADREIDGLAVRVHYPVDAPGPLPVVVFLHGLGGSRLGYGYLGRAWAARGYVSIHPSHRENIPFGPAELERPGVAALRAMKAAIDDSANWEARPRDVAAVIDAVSKLSNLIPALEGKLDLSRIAVAGHSYGAYTALLCAGARIQLDGRSRDFIEPRARAFIALSPPGNGSRGLDAASWARIEKPVLCITGTLDEGLAGQPPAWREESFQAMRPPDKTLVVIEGAEHFTFSGGRPRREANPAHLAAIESATLWFLDRFLGDDPRPFPALPSAAVRHR
jgi:predicted dienelactone hydrolase